MPHRTMTRDSPILTTVQDIWGGDLDLYCAELGQEAFHVLFGAGNLHRHA